MVELLELFSALSNIIHCWPANTDGKPVTDKSLDKAEYRPIYNLGRSDDEQQEEDNNR